jgi:hypothetical protein
MISIHLGIYPPAVCLPGTEIMDDDEIDVWELQEMSPEEIEEKYPVSDDHPLVQETGQRHSSSRMAPVPGNTIRYLFIEGMSERVRELSEELQQEVRENGNNNTELPISDIGLRLYEIHAMALSFFEASSYLLTRDCLRRGNEPSDGIRQWYKESDKDNIQWGMSSEGVLEAILTDLEENATAAQYQSMLYQAGLLDDHLNDVVYQVRTTRNDFTHNPLRLMRVFDDDEILDMIIDCIGVAEGIEDLLDSELETDESIYRAFDAI